MCQGLSATHHGELAQLLAVAGVLRHTVHRPPHVQRVRGGEQAIDYLQQAVV